MIPTKTLEIESSEELGCGMITFEGSTFWKFLTTVMTRSVTSDLSRNDPFTSSEKNRPNTREMDMAGTCRGESEALTLRCFSTALRTAAIAGALRSLSREGGGTEWSNDRRSSSRMLIRGGFWSFLRKTPYKL